MSDFKAKMHQIRFLLGLRPTPHHTPQISYLYLMGLLLMGGRETRGDEEKVKGREGEEVAGGIWPTQKCWRGTPTKLCPIHIADATQLSSCPVGVVNAPVRSRGPVNNDVIVEKVINRGIDQNSRSQTAMFSFQIVDRIRVGTRQSS